MKYIDKLLFAQEQVVVRARIHWFVYVWPSCMLLASIICFGAYDTANSRRSFSLLMHGQTMAALVLMAMTAVLLMAWAVVAFLRANLYACTTELALTNQRMIMKRCWIASDVMEVCGEHIAACRFEQSVLGRIFNYGTLVVVCSRSHTYQLVYVASPLRLQAAVAQMRTLAVHEPSVAG